MKKITSILIGILFIGLAFASEADNSPTYPSVVNGTSATIEVNKNFNGGDLDYTAKDLCSDVWQVVNENPSVDNVTLNIKMKCTNEYGEEKFLTKKITLDSEWMRKVEIKRYKTKNDFNKSYSYLSLMGELDEFEKPCSDW